MILVIATLLAASVALNAFLLLKRGLPPKHETYDAQQLLRDLMAGEALVKITRVAPVDVFLRSPRGGA